MNRYERALAELARLEPRGVRLGLEHVREYCARAGNPQSRYPVIHVAGTNGKGTTIAALEALALEAGLRTGVYTSPHLIDFRERIRIDREPIDPEALTDLWDRVVPHASDEGLTYFEATTLMAFEHFAARSVDLALIEVGLGGRLDATTVVEPEATVITSVGLDHERYLGSDLSAIATEKAGILKDGVPAFSADPRSPGVRSALTSAAERTGASLRFIGEEVSIRQVGGGGSRTERFDYRDPMIQMEAIEIPLTGAHFIEDAALALWTWNTVRRPLPASAIRDALARLRIAGRSEWHCVGGVDVLLDVAHNPDAVSALVAALETPGAPRAALVCGFLSDKRWEEMIDGLAPLTARGWICGLPNAPQDRRIGYEAVDPALASRTRLAWADGVAEGLEAAFGSVRSGETDFVLVTGSFYTVGAALEALGLAARGEPYAPAPFPRREFA